MCLKGLDATIGAATKITLLSSYMISSRLVENVAR